MTARQPRPSSLVRHRSRRHGLFVAEMLLGLFLMIAVATVTAVMLARQTRVSQRLAESRAAQRLAESVLLDLQCGRSAQLSQGTAEPRVDVQALDGASGVGTSRWVRVEVTYDGRRASLIGLVPTGATTQPEEGGGR